MREVEPYPKGTVVRVVAKQRIHTDPVLANRAGVPTVRRWWWTVQMWERNAQNGNILYTIQTIDHCNTPGFEHHVAHTGEPVPLTKRAYHSELEAVEMTPEVVAAYLREQ